MPFNVMVIYVMINMRVAHGIVRVLLLIHQGQGLPPKPRGANQELIEPWPNGPLPVLWDSLTSDFPPYKGFHMPLLHNKQQTYCVAQYASMKLSIEHCIFLLDMQYLYSLWWQVRLDNGQAEKRSQKIRTLLECYRDLYWTCGLKPQIM